MADTIPPLVRSFLREDYAAVDPKLPAILAELKRVGATECWCDVAKPLADFDLAARARGWVGLRGGGLGNPRGRTPHWPRARARARVCVCVCV